MLLRGRKKEEKRHDTKTLTIYSCLQMKCWICLHRFAPINVCKIQKPYSTWDCGDFHRRQRPSCQYGEFRCGHVWYVCAVCKTQENKYEIFTKKTGQAYCFQRPTAWLEILFLCVCASAAQCHRNDYTISYFIPWYMSAIGDSRQKQPKRMRMRLDCLFVRTRSPSSRAHRTIQFFNLIMVPVFA